MNDCKFYFVAERYYHGDTDYDLIFNGNKYYDSDMTRIRKEYPFLDIQFDERVIAINNGVGEHVCLPYVTLDMDAIIKIVDIDGQLEIMHCDHLNERFRCLKIW